MGKEGCDTAHARNWHSRLSICGKQVRGSECVVERTIVLLHRHLGPTMETKMTVVFLDLTEETMSLGDAAVIADDYLLLGEEDESMIDLPIVKTGDGQVLISSQSLL